MNDFRAFRAGLVMRLARRFPYAGATCKHGVDAGLRVQQAKVHVNYLCVAMLLGDGSCRRRAEISVAGRVLRKRVVIAIPQGGMPLSSEARREPWACLESAMRATQRKVRNIERTDEVSWIL